MKWTPGGRKNISKLSVEEGKTVNKSHLPGVLIGVSQDGGDESHWDDLHDRVLAEPGGLSKAAPPDVASDENGSDDASHHTCMQST